MCRALTCRTPWVAAAAAFRAAGSDYFPILPGRAIMRFAWFSPLARVQNCKVPAKFA